MGVVILVLVVIAALFAIFSGAWVALALITAISAHRTTPDIQHQTNEQSNDQDI
jgi:hypothetical protein